MLTDEQIKKILRNKKDEIFSRPDACAAERFIKEMLQFQERETRKEIGEWYLKGNRYLDFGRKQAESLARGEKPE